jgi:dienelactone hydrolase
VDFPEGLADAFGALRLLASSPEVDATRIAAVGFSQGADTALSISTRRFPAAFAPPGGPSFKAVAAFYPPCANQGGAPLTLPTLILIGERDTVTPAADCQRLADAQPRDAPGARVLVYPGAAHGFDNPGFSSDAPVLGMTLRYDGRSAGQSWRALEAFLAAHLMR